jgi:2-amino-4-hydroxy-6-hydroxymethyldihydropteridine diphosphokinase
MDALRKVRIYLSLGTNIGDREKNLEQAVDALKQELSALKRSHIYETLPLYMKDQPEFLNCVVTGKTAQPPIVLLDYLLDFEKAMGRERGNIPAKGPRIIDIDILLYNKKIIQNERLQIPHPGIYEREFVLKPLLELEPGLQDPVSGKPFSLFLERLRDQGVTLYRKGSKDGDKTR